MNKETHDCIGKLRTQMMQNNEDLTWVRFDLSTIVNSDTPSGEYKPGSVLNTVTNMLKRTVM